MATKRKVSFKKKNNTVYPEVQPNGDNEEVQSNGNNEEIQPNGNNIGVVSNTPSEETIEKGRAVLSKFLNRAGNNVKSTTQKTTNIFNNTNSKNISTNNEDKPTTVIEDKPTTNVEDTPTTVVEDTPTNKSENETTNKGTSWLSRLRDYAKKGASAINNGLQNLPDAIKNSYDNNNTENTTNASAWQQYQNELAQNSVNQKAELAAINQRANSYVNQYLKSIGLAGTGEGVNQITNNAYNLANAYSDVNANEQAQLESAREANAQRLTNLYQTAIENGASAREIDKMAQNYEDDSLTSGTKQYLDDYANAVGVNWESDKEYVIADLENYDTSDLTKRQKTQYNAIVSKLKNANSEDEFYELYDKYEDLLSNSTEISEFDKDGYYNASEVIDSLTPDDLLKKVLSNRILSKLEKMENGEILDLNKISSNISSDYKIKKENGKYYVIGK